MRGVGLNGVPPVQARRLQRAYRERLDLVVTRGLGRRRIIGEPTVVDQVIGFISAGLGVTAA